MVGELEKSEAEEPPAANEGGEVIVDREGVQERERDGDGVRGEGESEGRKEGSKVFLLTQGR